MYNNKKVGLFHLVCFFLMSQTLAYAEPVINEVLQRQTKIYVIGEGFDVKTAYTINFGGVPAKGTPLSSSVLLAELPSGAKKGPVLVYEGKEVVAASKKEYAFTNTTILGFAPTSGKIGDSIIITGKGFDPIAMNNIVIFKDKETIPEDGNETFLLVKVPDGVKSGSLIWKSKITEAEVSSGQEFKVGPPTFLNFVPPKASKGDKIIIKGDNFAPDVQVYFADRANAATRRLSPNLLETVVPVAAIDGPITVITPEGKVTSQTDVNGN